VSAIIPRRNLFMSLLALSIAAATALAVPPSTTFHNINVPGALSTQALGINNKSQIVGAYQTSSAGHGFLLINGKYQTLDFPGGQFTSANAINDSGEIVGSTDINGAIQGFVMSAGKYAQVSYPANGHNSATGVNNAGVVVGTTWDSSGTASGFKYVNGAYTEITIPGASYTEIGGINNNGDISGSYFVGEEGYGFILHPDGTYQTISDPGHAGESGVSGINDKEWVVGTYSPNPQTQTIYGFLDTSGHFTTINHPNFVQTIAMGVNNSGVVVGYGYNSQNQVSGFWVTE
jgi:probable HAF family extracellular repeat protein